MVPSETFRPAPEGGKGAGGRQPPLRFYGLARRAPAGKGPIGYPSVCWILWQLAAGEVLKTCFSFALRNGFGPCASSRRFCSPLGFAGRRRVAWSFMPQTAWLAVGHTRVAGRAFFRGHYKMSSRA